MVQDVKSVPSALPDLDHSWQGWFCCRMKLWSKVVQLLCIYLKTPAGVLLYMCITELEYFSCVVVARRNGCLCTVKRMRYRICSRDEISSRVCRVGSGLVTPLLWICCESSTLPWRHFGLFVSLFCCCQGVVGVVCRFVKNHTAVMANWVSYWLYWVFIFR